MLMMESAVQIPALIQTIFRYSNRYVLAWILRILEGMRTYRRWAGRRRPIRRGRHRSYTWLQG